MRDELTTSTKSFAISKRQVWQAWKRVRANRGAAGIDQQSIEGFEKNLAGNLYTIWNRMASGSYFPPPVKEVGIPKKDGGVRILGVPTVADRVAQTVAKEFLEQVLEPHFDPDSYGYRPSRSAKDAIRVTRRRCWKYDWVLEFDVKGAFDNLDHDLLWKALRRHTDCRWVLLYVGRWLNAPSVSESGGDRPRDRGTPQGSVVGPVLMNLFMHYTFDRWMRRKVASCPFARYADDAAVHCSSEREAVEVKRLLTERFAACGLELHPEKTRVVYCKDGRRRAAYPTVQFTFLGFTFRPRRAKSPDGKPFTGFLPGVSQAALTRMRRQIHRWHIPRQTPGTLDEFSRTYGRTLTGWWNYYGSFYPSAFQCIFRHFDLTLSRWIRRKSKRLRDHRRRSCDWVARVAQREPHLFFHWRVGFALGRTMGAV